MNEIVWHGDLEDDCNASWNGLRAHVEKMDENEWYFSVYVPNTPVSEPDLFHSTDDNALALTGEAGRRLCEYIMRSEVFGKENAELRGLLEEALDVMRTCRTGSDYWENSGIGGKLFKTIYLTLRKLDEQKAS